MNARCDRCGASVHEVRMTCNAPEQFHDTYTLTCEFCDEALHAQVARMEAAKEAAS